MKPSFHSAPAAAARKSGTRRTLLAAAVTVAASLLPWSGAQAQASGGAYPNKPVRIIVGFPAGTGPDIVARLLGGRRT